MFGDAKNPRPAPKSIMNATREAYGVVASVVEKRKRERLITARPVVVKGTWPYLSERRPLRGPAARVAMSSGRTDPDREGEAISWHIREVLKNRRALKDIDVKRVVFNEVTRNAVLDAFRHPREIDGELVDAYLARRALDYLVGFTLSPVLWRKLPGSRSAGRVQSVALRLVCEREAEIEAFRPREYWTIEVEFQTEAGDRFTARLSHLDGKKLDRFEPHNEAKARAAADRILAPRGVALPS